MSAAAELPRPAPLGGRVPLPRIGAIDCDLHPALPSMQALLPYLSAHWRDQVVLRGIDGLDSSSYPVRVPANARPDWRLGHGKPGSDPDLLRAQALDAFGLRFAICNCLYGVPAVYNADFAAALARAVNEWIAREWLDRDTPAARVHRGAAAGCRARRGGDRALRRGPPLRAGAAAGHGRDAARPARALADLSHRRAPRPAGRHPCRQHLPPRAHPVTAGPPTISRTRSCSRTPSRRNCSAWFPKACSRAFPISASCCSNPASPGCRNFLWRATRTWRAMRAEVPWVDRAPADIIRDHVRVTLQPTDAPPRPEDMARVLRHLGADQMLLFSTDYPHWHFDADEALPAGPAGGAHPPHARGQRARDLSAAQGGAVMSEVSGSETRIDAAARGRLRRASRHALAARPHRVPAPALARPSRHVRPAPADPVHRLLALSEGGAGAVARRCLAGERAAGLRSRFPAPPVARCV